MWFVAVTAYVVVSGENAGLSEYEPTFNPSRLASFAVSAAKVKTVVGCVPLMLWQQKPLQ